MCCFVVGFLLLLFIGGGGGGGGELKPVHKQRDSEQYESVSIDSDEESSSALEYNSHI